jgi:hypothetical protein
MDTLMQSPCTPAKTPSTIEAAIAAMPGSSPSLAPMPSSSPSDLESPGFALATPPRLRPISEDDEADTPLARVPSGSGSGSGSGNGSFASSDWNKENVPVGGGYRETPTNSKRSAFASMATTSNSSSKQQQFLKMLSETSSTGASPAFDNLLKRPLAPTNGREDANSGFMIKRPRRGKNVKMFFIFFDKLFEFKALLYFLGRIIIHELTIILLKLSTTLKRDRDSESPISSPHGPCRPFSALSPRRPPP